MKFSCQVDEFVEAYGMVAWTLDRMKSAEATTRMLLIKALKEPPRLLLFSTDGVASSVRRVPAQVEEGGAALVDPYEMGRVLPALEPDLTLSFETSGEKLQMVCGKFRPRCATADCAKALAMLDGLPLRGPTDVEVPGWALREVLERTMRFACRPGDELLAMQGFLQNVLVRVTAEGCLEAHASNGKVMAKALVNLGRPMAALEAHMPVRSAPALTKILSQPQLRPVAGEAPPMLRLQIQGEDKRSQRLIVKSNRLFFSTTLAAVRVPVKAIDFEESIGSTVTAVAALRRELLLAVLRRCEPFLGKVEGMPVLALHLEGGVVTVLDRDGADLDHMEVSGWSDGVGSARMELKHMRMALETIPEEIVTMRFIRSGSAVLWNAGEAEKGRSLYGVACMPEVAERR